MPALKPLSQISWFWLILFGSALIHRMLPVQSSHDSFLYIPTAISLCAEGNTDLDEFGTFLESRSYHATVEVKERTYNLFPLMPSLIAAPLVCSYRWLIDLQLKARGDSLSSYEADQSPLFRKANTLERGLASLLIGLTTAFFFLLARQHLAAKPALAVTAFASFGTALVSIGSRALWPHTIVLPCIAMSLYFLEKARRSSKVSPWLFLVAIPVSFTYLARPTNAIFVIGFSLVFLEFFKWRRTLPFALLGGAIALAFFGYNQSLYGEFFSPYFEPSRVGQTGSFWNAFLANFLSPSRGLFVFNPIFGLILGYTAWRLITGKAKPTAADGMCLGIISLSMIVIATFPHWWGGHSYGPRFLTDLVPFFFLLGLKLLEARPWSTLSPGHRIVIGICLAFGVYVHLNGALNAGANLWNNHPSDVDQNPERIWDVSDPQFFRH